MLQNRVVFLIKRLKPLFLDPYFQFCKYSHASKLFVYLYLYLWAPRGFGDLGRMAIYFQGSGEQAHSFRDLGSPAKKQKKIKEKPPFCLIF